MGAEPKRAAIAAGGEEVSFTYGCRVTALGHKGDSGNTAGPATFGLFRSYTLQYFCYSVRLSFCLETYFKTTDAMQKYNTILQT